MADSKDDGTTTVHWTQTPAGKQKMARVQRKAWKARRRKARDARAASNHTPSRKKKPHASRRYADAATRDASPSPSSNHASHRIAPDLVAYALGRIEGFIEHYARSAGVSESTLTAELGAILYGKGGR